MNELKFEEMSNSEIKIKLIEFENEYQAIQNKINQHFNRMKELDKLFNNGKKELKKRKVI